MAYPTGKQIVLWGDSLGKGVVWNTERARYSYADVTAAHIVEEKLQCKIFNFSRFGCTAPMGIDAMQKALLKDAVFDAALLEFGGNDCNFDWAAISEAPDKPHFPNTLPEQFQTTLKSMIVLLQKARIRPVLTTLPPINPERYFRFFVGEKLSADNILRWLGDVWQIYRFQEMYSLIISDTARRMGVELLDLRTRCLAIPGFIRDDVCMDGLHLNECGQVFAGEQLSLLAMEGGC